MRSFGVSAWIESQSPKLSPRPRSRMSPPPILEAPVDPFLHAGEVLLEEALVAVGLVHGPWADDAGVGPCGRVESAAAHANRLGRDVRICAVSRWASSTSTSHFEKKEATSRVRRRGADEDLCVTHPAEALITLRAVCRHAEEVAALTPEDVLGKLVDVGVRAGERAVMSGVSEPRTMPSSVSSEGFSGRPEISTNWKPWKVKRAARLPRRRPCRCSCRCSGHRAGS